MSIRCVMRLFKIKILTNTIYLTANLDYELAYTKYLYLCLLHRTCRRADGTQLGEFATLALASADFHCISVPNPGTVAA